MARLPLSPFITDPDNRFVLDEDAFMAAIEPESAEAGEEYLAATQIQPIVDVLAGYMR